MTRGIAVVAVTCALAPGGSPPQAATPALADLLRLGAQYLETYTARVSGVTLEEQFVLIEVSGTQMRVPQRIASDVVFVKIHFQEQVVGLRDPFSIDTKAVRERQPRITRVLAEPTLANWEVAQGYAREHAILLLANVVLWFSDPALAVRFIAGPNQPRLTYTLEGRKRMNGVQVLGIGFKERQAPGTTYLLDKPGNPVSSGRFWIDPATGAIHGTELWVQSETDTARIQVTYAPDKTLDLLLPREAIHTFETRERGSGGSPIGPRGTKLAFEASARYSNPRYTPIDLSRIVR
jgi:hypothetical protein